MISANQKRNHIRVGTNLVAKVSHTTKTEKYDKIVYIKDVSATGAKIQSKEKLAAVGETMTIKFRYKDVLYDILCKIVRIEDDDKNYGIQFYFKGDSYNNINTNIISSNKNKLNNDILQEYFDYKDCYA